MQLLPKKFWRLTKLHSTYSLNLNFFKGFINFISGLMRQGHSAIGQIFECH